MEWVSTNMSAEFWHSCLFQNRACFLKVDLHWFFQCTQEVKTFDASNLNWFQRTCFLTALGRYPWQPIETINGFYYSIYFKGNQLKQINFFIIAYIVKLVSVIYFFHQMIVLQKLWKKVFSSKKLFLFSRYQFFVFFPSLQNSSKLKRTNERGI